jgi:threonine dehydrogenase-like Zn-dependent dehydrogenase
MSEKMLCWPLFGVGFDNLGKNRQPCEWNIPRPKENELLVRIDAIGLCFSDVKLVRAGEDHPRVYSKDLSADPVIPGHEAVMTVVEAGKDVAAQYPVGSRYIIQADIYVNGENWAYGYAIDGGMAQYSIIDQRVLNGDEGSYLLPLGDQTPAAVAALIEPWTCVIASYLIEHRRAPKQGGRMLAAMEPGHEPVYSCDGLAANAAPEVIDCLNVNADTAAALASAFPKAAVNEMREIPCGVKYDDIVLCGVQTPALGETLARLGGTDAVISFVGNCPNEVWNFDVGSIHYKGWFYQGTPGANIAAAYGRNVRCKLRKGGTCWLVGGAGAMGQMHTQLAVEDENGPARILVTDLDDTRIDSVVRLLTPRIQERGIEFKTLNPKHFESEAEFLAAVREFSPEGFQDIVMLVPVVPVVNSAVSFLAEDGLMNIFAGIPAGKEACLNVGDIVRRGVRYIGSSGSRTAHLRHTLELVETGKLQPVTALAAVGGMRALWEGLQGVAEARFPGKTVIFPQCEDMPLVPVTHLEQLGREIADSISDDGFYTLETEAAIVRKYGK